MTPRLSSTFRRYLPEYRQRRKELLDPRAKRHIHQYRESVLSIWEASFEAIEDHNPTAARLLSLLVFVKFEDVFNDLFDRDCGFIARGPTYIAESSEAMTSPGKTWRPFLFCGQKWTVYDLQSALGTPQHYLLNRRELDQGSYATHKLLHAQWQDRREADRQRQLSSLTFRLMADAIA